jgi:4-amino-4-deoxy-L-arabinose transferase-like glycosyltransferase
VDEQDYVHLARHLVQHGEYAYEVNVPTSLRPPLYPALVAAVFAIAGVDNFQAVRLVQIVLGLATVVAVFRLGREVYSERVGLWAAGLACFYPSFVGTGNLLLTETLFIFLLTAGIGLVARALKRGEYLSLAAAGVVLGLGALTRSVLYPFAPVLGLFLFAAWGGSFLRRAAVVLAFVIPFVVVLAPWAIRNTAVHRTFIPIDCMGGRNFMMGNYEHTPLYRAWDAISIEGDRSWDAVLRAKHPELAMPGTVTQGQLDQIALKEGVRFVRENPGLTARRDVVKFFDFWGLERELVAGADRGYFGAIPRIGVLLLGLVVCGAYVLVLFTGAFGAAVVPPADRRLHVLLLLVAGFICAIHTAVFAHSRYHLPVMPFMMIYAAAAVTGPGVWSARGRPAFWLAVAFCLIVLAGWAWNAAAGDLGKLGHVLSAGS